MKHIFIINPNSGKNEKKEELINQLELYKDKIDYEIYTTKGVKDATRYVDEYCNKYKDDVTFYACGGDGTINEVANGLVNHKNGILACYPCGSGNDFVKVYGGKEKFLNLENLLNGEEIKIDIMKVNDSYAVNVTNFGFDAIVCDTANKIRRKKLIGGKNSYTTGVIANLFTGRKNKCKVSIDGETLPNKEVLFSTIANGKYIGGAYLCAPNSNNQDGLLEVTVVKPVSLFKFAKLLNPYKQGKHLEMPEFKNIVTYKRAKNIKVEADNPFKICLDGEIYEGKEFNISNIKEGIRFIKPKE